MNRWYYIGGGVVVAAAVWWYLRNKRPPGQSAPDSGRGATMSVKPPASAVLEDEIAALSRTMESEAATGGKGPTGIAYTDAERLAIGATTRNHYYRHGLTIASGQGSAHIQYGSYASSERGGNAQTDALAAQVLTDGFEDPTNGALSFFEPLEEDAAYARGIVGYRYDAAKLRDHWSGADGSDNRMELYVTIGQWEFWGPKRKATQ